MRLCFCPLERENKTLPQLVYVSQVSESDGPFVRFMHMHPQTVELILITEGEGNTSLAIGSILCAKAIWLFTTAR
jgi:hypothetical protein